MKKYFTYTLIFASLFSFDAKAQISFTEEAKALGALSGLGLFCESAKHETFEMLAFAVIKAKAPTKRSEKSALKIYSESKAETYIMKKRGSRLDNCSDVLVRFDNQDIFDSTLYRDGTIKMSNGKTFSPKTKYDVNKVLLKK